MKQTRRSFFSLLAGAMVIGAPGLRTMTAERKLALVCHRGGWEDGRTGRPARGQFKSIDAARKAGYSDDCIVVPPSHIEPPDGDHEFPR